MEHNFSGDIDPVYPTHCHEAVVPGTDGIEKSLIGATIIAFGTVIANAGDFEGGGLFIDYIPAGGETVHRIVCAFNELGMWEEYCGPKP